MKNKELIMGLVIGFLVGGIGGYALGSYLATSSDVNAVPEAAIDAAGTDVLGDIETNPLENVRLNPFE